MFEPMEKYEASLAHIAGEWIRMRYRGEEPIVIDMTSDQVSYPDTFEQFFLAETEHLPIDRERALESWVNKGYLVMRDEPKGFVFTDLGLEHFGQQ